MIPEDWKVVPVGQLLRRPPSYGINAPAISFDSRFPVYLRITDITEDGKFAEATKTSVGHPAAASYRLESGDIVFARTGATVGKSYLYNPQDGRLVYAGFLICLSPDPERLVPTFLSFYARSQPYWSWVKVNSIRSGQPGINGNQYASLPVPLPLTLAEQEAIAEALSHADALIESLEQLLTKKHQIKKGAMQDLLTGKKRLPGFSGEWERTALGRAADIKNGATPSTQVTAFWKGSIPWCTPTDITGTPGKYLLTTERSITAEGLTSCAASLLPTGALLLCSRATIGEVKIAASPVCTNQGFKSLVCKDGVSNEFLYYLLVTLKPQMMERASGSTFLEIGKRAVAAIEVRLPPCDE